MTQNPFFHILAISSVILFSAMYFLLNGSSTFGAFAPLSIDDVAAVSGVSARQEDLFVPDGQFSPFPVSEDVKNSIPEIIKKSVGPDPVLDSGMAIVMDSLSGKIIFSRDANRTAPIASITKLMTALVFLDNNPGWEQEYQIRPEDKVEGGKEYIYNGDVCRIKDLFYLSLVGSANSATLALAHATGLEESGFIAAMNKKARDLNLEDTSFADPVGLSNHNVSTALEVAKIAKIALADESIRTAVLSKQYEFATAGGRNIKVFSTDALLDSYPADSINLEGGKTGYTEAAGYCFVGKFSQSGAREIITVVLGGPDIDFRFAKTKELTEWAYNSFEWQ